MWKQKLELLALARDASAKHRKRLPAQLLEMVRLRLGPGRLSPSAYYDFELYDDTRFSWEEKQRFLGWRTRVYDFLNDPAWNSYSEDKLTLYALLEAMNIRVPTVYAVYSSRRRVFGDRPCFTNVGELITFLRSEIAYPFFGKPSHGGFGKGAILVQQYSSTDDSFVLGNGDKLPLGKFVHELGRYDSLGYIFSAVMQPAEGLRPLCGDRLSSVRVTILMTDEGPRILATEWKVPTGRNMIDNYSDGRSGNLLALVDEESGEVSKVIKGGPGGRDCEPVEIHPDTGARLVGARLPDWKDLRTFASRAALTLPRMRLQGWDIACTPDGPVALEVNVGSSDAIYGSQLLTGRGFLDGEMLQMYRRLRGKDGTQTL